MGIPNFAKNLEVAKVSEDPKVQENKKPDLRVITRKEEVVPVEEISGDEVAKMLDYNLNHDDKQELSEGQARYLAGQEMDQATAENVMSLLRIMQAGNNYGEAHKELFPKAEQLAAGAEKVYDEAAKRRLEELNKMQSGVLPGWEPWMIDELNALLKAKKEHIKKYGI